MKVHELIAQLQQYNPNGEVAVEMDAAMAWVIQDESNRYDGAAILVEIDELAYSNDGFETKVVCKLTVVL